MSNKPPTHMSRPELEREVTQLRRAVTQRYEPGYKTTEFFVTAVIVVGCMGALLYLFYLDATTGYRPDLQYYSALLGGIAAAAATALAWIRKNRKNELDADLIARLRALSETATTYTPERSPPPR